MKKLSLVLTMLCFAVAFAVAQRTVVGTVVDDGGEALIGASVQAKGTNAGTVTDVNGKFSLNVPREASAIIVSYTGYATQELTLGASNVLSFTLSNSADVSEVVVTALGIKREKKSLGYAATVISASEIAEKPETDVARALAGRSPGVMILGSAGLAGSGTKINIRGTSTITGDSQPLWVVDGVPVNTAQNQPVKDFRDGQISPTRNLDIDPNNIETMSVLRGLSATTLYGSQGRNGVILITTKTGGASKKRFSGSVSQSYNQVEAFVPEFQNKWGNGFDGDYGEFFSNWGTVFDGKAPTNAATGAWNRHPYYEHRALFATEHPEFGLLDGSTEAKGYIPAAAPNNVRDFFQTGYSATTSVNAGVSGDLGSFNVNYSRTGEEGYIAGNNLERNNFALGGTANLTKRLHVTSNFSFIKTEFKSPPVGAGTGSNSEGQPSVFANLMYTPRNMDLMNWPYKHPITGASVYYRNNNSITNPRWLLENSSIGSKTNRFMGSTTVSYDLLDWMKLSYRIGLDNYSEDQSNALNKGSVGHAGTVAVLANGLLRTTTGVNTIFDHSAILSGQRNLTGDFDLAFNFGANARRDDYRVQGVESTNQVVFGLLEHRNFINHSTVSLRQDNLSEVSRKMILGAFGDLGFSYKNFMYLNLMGRNDWASTHEQDQRSRFYPGMSISFIPTQAFAGLESKNFNFLKLRFGYGTSANFADPYKTRPYLEIVSKNTVDANGDVVTLALPVLLANPNLRPELLRETEAGLDLTVIDRRLDINFSVYSRTAKDQIVGRRLDPSSGFDETTINAGTITNKGIEIGAAITPVRTKNVTLNFRANFTKNVSNVPELPDESKSIFIDGFSNLGSYIEEGQPYGVIKGTAAVRNANGDYLISANGDYVISDETQIIGDPNPDYTLNSFMDLTVKGVTLSAQFDYVKGGQIFSYSAGTLVGRGVAKELESFNPELTVILPGVLEDGTPNNIPMPASGVFFGNTIIGGGPNDRGIFDATRVRLREIALSYSVPKSIFGESFIQGAIISITGNNMWFRTINTPKYSYVDPERSAFGNSNGIGFDFLGGPAAKRYGVNVKFNF